LKLPVGVAASALLPERTKSAYSAAASLCGHRRERAAVYLAFLAVRASFLGLINYLG